MATYRSRVDRGNHYRNLNRLNQTAERRKRFSILATGTSDAPVDTSKIKEATAALRDLMIG